MQNRYPIKTNFEDLDRFIGGLYPGEIMVFGSYPRVDRLSFLATLIKKITLKNNFGDLGEINLPFSTETYSYEEYPASIKSSLIL